MFKFAQYPSSEEEIVFQLKTTTKNWNAVRLMGLWWAEEHLSSHGFSPKSKSVGSGTSVLENDWTSYEM